VFSAGDSFETSGCKFVQSHRGYKASSEDNKAEQGIIADVQEI
jgi:hypothetical protein